MRFSEVRRGGWDPKARLEEQDVDGVDAEVLYPTPRLSWGVTGNPDPQLQLAMVKAYNDWISEYCGYAPDRLGGAALLPNCGVAAAVAEFERIAERPGIVCATINRYPHGDLDLREEDDAVWNALSDAKMSLSIHVGLTDQMPGHTQKKLPGDARFYDAPRRMLQFIYSGTLDRVPHLNIVFAEVDCGWIPYFREQVQDRFQRMSTSAEVRIAREPREYFVDRFYFTYVTDSYAVRNRDAIGVDRMMWSSDYPHVGADWPNSRRTIQATMAGVPEADRALILAGNALRLYHFGEVDR
jgi:predicted TIM-barrel fold metal-dependent hydrolase